MELMISDMLRKANMARYDVGSSHLVEVTHINDPKSFYVRLSSFSDDIELLEARGEPMSDADVSIGKRVVYRSKYLGKFVRGDIEFILFRQSSVVCNIIAIDYGCRERLVDQKLIYLPKYKIPCPPLAIQCQLHLCEPKGETFDHEALDAMRYFVGTHTAKITIRIKTLDKLIVELRTVECPDDVSTMLGLLHFTTLTSGVDQAVNMFSNFTLDTEILQYQKKLLKVGDKLRVRVQSGDDITSFFVADVNDYDAHKSEVHQFVEYCKRQPMQDVAAAAIDERCCGIRVNQSLIYERGIVKRITVPNTKALVCLIDWGKEMECYFCDIKRVSSEVYTSQPAIAIHCSATEDQTWHNGLPKFLYPGYTFDIEIKELGNGSSPNKVKLTKV